MFKARLMAGLTAGVIAGTCLMPKSAEAAGRFGPIFWITASWSKTVTTNPGPPPSTTTTYTLVLDPPAFSSIDVTIDFNPSLFSFNGGGPLCDFAVGGTCPPVDSTRGLISPIPTETIIPGTKLPGSTLSLTSSTGSVHLVYDLSGATNPPAAGADANFFALFFDPLVPLQNAVINQGTPGTYDVTLSSVSCTIANPAGQCATNNPSYGFTFAVPEPTSLALLGAGLAGIGLTRRRRSV